MLLLPALVHHLLSFAATASLAATFATPMLLLLLLHSLRSWPGDVRDDTHLGGRQGEIITVAEEAAKAECQRRELLPVRGVRALQGLADADVPPDLGERRQHLGLDIGRGVRQE